MYRGKTCKVGSLRHFATSQNMCKVKGEERVEHRHLDSVLDYFDVGWHIICAAADGHIYPHMDGLNISRCGLLSSLSCTAGAKSEYLVTLWTDPGWTHWGRARRISRNWTGSSLGREIVSSRMTASSHLRALNAASRSELSLSRPACQFNYRRRPRREVEDCLETRGRSKKHCRCRKG